MSAGRLISTWLAGRKTLTPAISTRSPPLIFRRTNPVTTSSSRTLDMTRSQSSIRRALRFERVMRPRCSSTIFSSMSSRRTLITSPASGAGSVSSHSFRGIWPSLLYPTSTRTNSSSTRKIFPSTTLLTAREGAWPTSKSAASLPPIARSISCSSSSPKSSSRIRFRLTIRSRG